MLQVFYSDLRTDYNAIKNVLRYPDND